MIGLLTLPAIIHFRFAHIVLLGSIPPVVERLGEIFWQRPQIVVAAVVGVGSPDIHGGKRGRARRPGSWELAHTDWQEWMRCRPECFDCSECVSWASNPSSYLFGLFRRLLVKLVASGFRHWGLRGPSVCPCPGGLGCTLFGELGLDKAGAPWHTLP